MEEEKQTQKAKETILPQKSMAIRTNHLKSLKIANSETIAAFIKNHQAYFENHTRDRLQIKKDDNISEAPSTQRELSKGD